MVMTSAVCDNRCLFCIERRPRDGSFHVREKYLRLYGSAYLPAGAYARLLAQTQERLPVIFEGGEPTLHPKLSGFIRAARRWGAPSVCLTTNGRALRSRTLCRRLIESGLSEIAVSIHGPTARLHDAATRVAGSFSQSLAGLRNVLSLKESFPLKVRVNSTISRLNYRHLGAHLGWLSSLQGLDLIVLNMVMVEGNARANVEALLAPLSEVASRLRTALREHGRRKGPGVRVFGLPYCLLRGFEDSVHPLDSILVLDGDGPQVRSDEKAKGPGCGPCRYGRACEGVWKGYVEHRGFAEFVPVEGAAP